MVFKTSSSSYTSRPLWVVGVTSLLLLLGGLVVFGGYQTYQAHQQKKLGIEFAHLEPQGYISFAARHPDSSYGWSAAFLGAKYSLEARQPQEAIKILTLVRPYALAHRQASWIAQRIDALLVALKNLSSQEQMP